MKKVLYLFFIFVCLVTISGCGVGSPSNKTEFKVLENANIDHYKLICEDYMKTNSYDGKSGFFLKVNYTITNNSSGDNDINLKEQFKIYDSNNILIDAVDTGSVYLASKESKNIEVVFEIDQATYEAASNKIIFYSKVVSNNIAFVLES